MNMPSNAYPEWLVIMVALLVLGATSELLYRYNAGAAWGFVLLIILGYMASGGNLTAIQDFFASFGISASNTRADTRIGGT